MQVGIILDDQQQQPDRQGHLDEFTKKEIDRVRSLRTLRDPAQAQREQKIGEHAYDAAQTCRNRSMKPCPSARDRNRHSGRHQLQKDHSEQLCNPKKKKAVLASHRTDCCFSLFQCDFISQAERIALFRISDN